MSDEKVTPIAENDIETEPGIGRPTDVLVLLRENTRLRAERNKALQELSLAELSLERLTMPPTPKQKWAAVGKWGALFTLVPALGAALAQLWPQYAALIDLVTGLFRP